MTAVFIASHREAQSMAKSLFTLLNKLAPCALCGFTCYDFSSPQPEICIIPCREGAKICAKKSISLLLSGSAEQFSPPAGGTVLTFGALPKAPVPPGVQLISCGLGARNTVTLSSLLEERAMLSVQRTVTALSGESIEVGEYPIRFKSADRTAIIAAAAIALLHFGTGRPLNFL